MRAFACRAAWVLVFGLVLASGCSDSDSDTVFITPMEETVPGSGTESEDRRDVAGVTGVSLILDAVLVIEQGAVEQVRITGDDNLVRLVETSISGGLLTIREPVNTNFEPTITIQVRLIIPVLDLDTIRVTGSGQIQMDGLDTTSLSTSLTGGGRIELAGCTVSHDVNLIGDGEIDAEFLGSESAAVVLIGDGAATVGVSDTLDVTVNGSGTVGYRGSPQVTGPGTQIDPSPPACP